MSDDRAMSETDCALADDVNLQVSVGGCGDLEDAVEVLEAGRSLVLYFAAWLSNGNGVPELKK